MKTTLIAYQERIHQKLSVFLERTRQTPPRLLEAIQYATLNQGKRIRPALLYAVGESLDTPIERLDACACALELIHCYSLVHDDLPAMDDDDLRRGKPTCHIQYDEATAILVGDAQQSLAYEAILTDNHLPATAQVEALRLLAHAAGPEGMIGGQVLDIESTGHAIPLETLQRLHEMKTGALIQAALLMGAVASPRYEAIRPGLADLGQKIGLAFQVQDDILDIESTTEQLGKPQGSDEAQAKSTYPKLMGLNEAKAFRDSLIQEAQNRLVQLQIDSPFLENLIRYIADRDH